MLEQILVNWEEYATIKIWKKKLADKSKRQELSPATWRTCKYWMKKFLKFTQKDPDSLIEEAVSDQEQGEERLRTFKRWCISKGIDENTAISGAYGTIRGFYRHNNVNTLNWTTPIITEKKVEQIDGNYPMFLKFEKNGKKMLVLNRELIQDFLARLNFRDQIIALSMISTGLDDGDLLKLSVGFVRGQSTERLYLSNHRSKTLEKINVFFSREATKKLRDYIKKERKNASDSDPLFVTHIRERKIQFRKQHGRKYQNEDHDYLPSGTRLRTGVLSDNFRDAAERMGIHIPKGQQNPLRPKRFRKIFRSGCTHAGLDPDIADIFVGHKGKQSKTYEGKSREELEFYYEMVEPKITVYTDIEAEKEDEIVTARQKFDEEMAKMRQDFDAKLKETVTEKLHEIIDKELLRIQNEELKKKLKTDRKNSDNY